MRVQLTLPILLALLLLTPFLRAEDVLVRVNGEPITQTDLDFLALSRRVPKERRELVRERLLDILVERQLMRSLLKSRGVEVDAKEIDRRIARLKQSLKENGEDPQAVLKRIGMDDDRLRNELALPLMWQTYLGTIVQPERIRKYYRDHQSQFDGTRLRARQIFRKMPRSATDEEAAAAKEELSEIRFRIVAGVLGFKTAVEQFSDAASKENGGDVGWFGWRGGLPANVSKAAFALEGDAISEPIRSPFGWHLVQVTDRKPGEISLEDARPLVLNALSQELWQEMVEKERETAKIEPIDSNAN
ncbi:peptidylprolyl isomerase [Thalassoroseus pseudoceratinae]|uniref:peptidylprolyl isomerase n=1 Tax=Thalassoroseus pseudoceratinae TaxID=2713176 RepID=UPI0014228AF4|nr:peptidylprolyl isomerase [Thalassoroseus pseudoceratinae]